MPAVLLAACDMALNWIRPIPNPPTAPASNPSSTSAGTLSRSAFFFFATFAISVFSAPNLLLIILAFALPLPDPGGGRKRLRQQEMAVEAPLARTIVQSFSPKGKLSEQQDHEFLVSWQKPPASTKTPGHPMIATL